MLPLFKKVWYNSLQILFLSQFVQQVEVISRVPGGWDYQVYDHDGQFTLYCIDATGAVRDIYRRLAISTLVEQIEPEEM